MNEVISNTLTAATAAARSSSQGTSVKANGEDPAQVGKILPPEPVPSSDQKASGPAMPDESLENVVAKMNDYFQNEQRNLEFNVDDDAGLTVIRVVDRESGDLIRQIPEDIFLRLAKQAREHEPIQLISVQG